MPRLDQGWNLISEDTLPAALHRAVTAHPDKLFLDFSGEESTYTDVDHGSSRIAAGLAQLGLRKGDRVASLLDNSLDAVLAWFATNRLGGIFVPINTAYRGEFLRHQLADSGARVLIIEGAYVDRIGAVADGLPDLEVILYRGEPVAVGAADRLQVVPLDDYRIGAGDSSNDVDVEPSDLCALMYTSGTTGPSKGCMVSHNYMIHTSKVGIRVADRQQGEVNWTALPLFHLNAASSVAGSMLLGSAASIAPHFSASGFWAEIERSGARVVNVIGSIIPLIAQAPDSDAMLRCKGQVRAVVGSPFTPEHERIWRERFEIESVGNVGYGLTEASAIVTGRIGTGKPGTSGRRNAEFDVRIFDGNDREVAAGKVGEIVCRPLTPYVMFDGYWHRPEATQALMRNLWFHTGDMGKFDEDGWFVFVDRKKDYLRRRGENISSFELERTFMMHPGVAEVAVHAVVSALVDDEVKVTAVRHQGSTLTEEELCRWSMSQLPYFAVPRYVEFRDQLPKNPVGRILKYQLRDEGCTATTWDREAAGVEVPRR